MADSERVMVGESQMPEDTSSDNEEFMYLVTILVRKTELVKNPDTGDLELPDHVCGMVLVYDDPQVAIREAEKMPGATVKKIRGE